MEIEPIIIEDDIIVIDDDNDENENLNYNSNRTVEVFDDNEVFEVLNEINDNEIRNVITRNNQLINELEVQRQRNTELQRENNSLREQYAILSIERDTMREANFTTVRYQTPDGRIHNREISNRYFGEINEAVNHYKILTETYVDRFSSVYYKAIKISNNSALHESRAYYNRREIFDNSEETKFYREQMHYFEDRGLVISKLIWLMENIEQRNEFIHEKKNDLGIYEEVHYLNTERVARMNRTTFEELKRNRRELDYFLNSYIVTRRYFVEMETEFDNKYIGENPEIKHDEFNYYRGINTLEDQNDPIVDINVIGNDEIDERYYVRNGGL